MATEGRVFSFVAVVVLIDVFILLTSSLLPVLWLSLLTSLMTMGLIGIVSVVFDDCSIPHSDEDCVVSMVHLLVIVLIPEFEVVSALPCISDCEKTALSSRKEDERRFLSPLLFEIGVASEEKANKKICIEKNNNNEERIFVGSKITHKLPLL